MKNNFNWALAGILVFIVLSSCDRKNILYSPDTKKRIYVSSNSSLFVKRSTFKIYYEKNDKKFAEFAFSNIGRIEVNWNTNLIQVRSYYFIRSDIDNRNIKCFKLDLEDIVDTSCCWTVYDMVLLSNRVYY